jgi:hypothetical protein
MLVTEIYYNDIDWRQSPYGLADMANDIALKADKNRTPEQREQFKKQVLQQVEADRLMQAQQVDLHIVGAAVSFFTRWGGRPVTGDAFEKDALDLLISAGQGDSFVVHALASATVQIVQRQLLHENPVLRPLAEGEQPRRLTRAEKEAAVQVIMEQYTQREGPLWKTMIERYRKQQHRERVHLAHLILHTLWKAMSRRQQKKHEEQ